MTRLAGYDFGKETFEMQVKNKVDMSKPIILVFPDNISKLASSFIQGFFGEWVEQIGIAGIEKNVIVESSNSNMHKEIVENLL